jgi:hypothetical protein
VVVFFWVDVGVQDAGASPDLSAGPPSVPPADSPTGAYVGGRGASARASSLSPPPPPPMRTPLVEAVALPLPLSRVSTAPALGEDGARTASAAGKTAGAGGRGGHHQVGGRRFGLKSLMQSLTGKP